jgi:hypothetical protein
MASMRTFANDERRNRLGVRHHLRRSSEPVELIVRDQVGLHSSDPVTVFLSAWARRSHFEARELEEALYERRSLVRMLGMRRTMFVVPIEVATVMNAACTRALAPAERKRLVSLVEQQGLAEDGAAWISEVEHITLAALRTRREATAAELTEDVAELGIQLRFGEGKTWAGTVGISTRLLFLLATEGKVIRGRPLGSWRSSQYRWATTEDWVGHELNELDPVEARRNLLRRWLYAYGPGTLIDLRWWTGWTVAQTKATLDQVEVVQVDLEEGTGYVLADDLEPSPDPGPWPALLPGLDPTVMGWKERGWFLGDHQPSLFDRNGNAGPTVWWHGRIVGGWAQRRDGELVLRLMEDVGSEAIGQIQAEANRLAAWLGEVRITPRFRTPLEKELAR